VAAESDVADAPAARLGVALRSARNKSGASIGDIAFRFRGGNTGRSHSYLYDVEKGRRFASLQLVDAYAEVCGEPELRRLRTALAAEESSEASEEGAVQTANAYSVLRALDQRASPDGVVSPEEWKPYADGFDPELLRTPYVVEGRQDSIRSVTQLISWAARSNRISGDIVLVSSEEDAVYFESGPEAGRREANDGLFRGSLLFQCIVECLLSRGHNLVHIRPPATTPTSLQAQIDALIKLLGFKGKYIPKDLDLRSPVPFHSILIPGVAAIQFVAAQSVFFCDAVLVTPDSASDLLEGPTASDAQFKLLQSHLNRVSRGASPVLEIVAAGTYPGPDAGKSEVSSLQRAIHRIDSKLLELDQRPGRRDLFKAGFAAVTCPPSQQHERRARFWKAFGINDETLSPWLNELDALTQARRDAHEQNLRSFPHIDVITRESITSYVATGRFAPPPIQPNELDGALDDYLGLDVPTPQERIEHIQRVITDLADYPNYELWIVDEADLGPLQGSGWAVKWNADKPSVAFFESVRTRSRGRGGYEQHYGACAITQSLLLDQIAAHADREFERVRGSSNLATRDELELAIDTLRGGC
jgi:hypothetical protein